MGLINSNKEVSKSLIKKGDEFKVKLSLSADGDIRVKPKDILLVLDQSGSMGTTPLEELKKGVNQFIDVIDEASDGKKDGVIGNGSRIGIVSFSTTAKIENYFVTSVNELKVSVSKLRSSGSTNHQDAFKKAKQVLEQSSANEKILIMFTDGDSNPGSEGYAEADEIKRMGTTIYSIGLMGTNVLDVDALKKWSSVPDSAFTLITPTVAEIENTFKNLTVNVTKNGATDICLTDVISDCFEVISVDNPTKGTGVIVDNKTVKWTVDSLGLGDDPEGAYFEFTVKNTGDCQGVVKVNKSITYTDKENNVINIPDPVVTISNLPEPTVEVIEDCPVPVDVKVPGCEDYLEFDAGDVLLNNLGRVLQLSATIKNVCPFKKVALAVILSETDANGVEYSRGMKTMLIPAHNESGCKDVLVRCIKFVLPEELDKTGSPESICNERNFRARFIANYIDTDYNCCEKTTN